MLPLPIFALLAEEESKDKVASFLMIIVIVIPQRLQGAEMPHTPIAGRTLQWRTSN
jgi:hypothetical protein